MSAVARLLFTYFAGTRLLRACTLGGSALFAAGLGLECVRARGDAQMLALACVLGVAAIFLGGGLLPVVFGALSLGRQPRLYPGGRSKLLISAWIAIGVIALLFASAVVAMYLDYPLDHREVFGKALSVSFLSFALMYLLLWFVGRARSAVGLLGGTVVLILSLGLPLHFIAFTDASLLTLGASSVLALCALSAGYLAAPRLRRASSSLRGSSRASRRPAVTHRAPAAGRELDLLLGTSPAWPVALGQLLPLGLATPLVPSAEIWIFFFALNALLSGAGSGFAAARARALWLRAADSREALFASVERCWWRRNRLCLCVLLLVFGAVGIHLSMAAPRIALGVPLIILANAVATYLGLTITRPLGWPDSMLALAGMGLMMTAAMFIGRSGAGSVWIAIGAEAALAALTLAVRAFARHRWQQLDWMDLRGA